MVDFITYTNQGAIRNKPLSPALVEAMSFLPGMGIGMEVFSGGQDASGPHRTGSTRHDHGEAADVFFTREGRRLDWRNQEDIPILQDIVRQANAAGLTGFGAGPNYMQPGSMHIGFGTPAVWGAGGKGVNAPDWLREVVSQTPAQAVAADTMTALGKAPAVSRNATQPEPLLGGQQMAEQPQQRGLRGLLSDPDKRDRLILGLEGMTLNPNTALQQAAAQGLQERGQQRQQQAQAGRTADFLRARGRADLADAVEAGLPAADALRTALSPAQVDETALIKNYKFAVEQGFEGSLTDFQQASKQGTNITVNTGAETSQFGDAPTGTVWALDEQGKHIMEPVPGSDRMRPVTVPLAGTQAEKRSQELAEVGAKNEAAAERASDSIRLIDSIIDDPALPSITGMIQGRIAPLTPAGTDLNVKVDQLKGQAFLQAFETLKGGGQITEREGIAAQNAIARLNRAQSTEAFQAALQELKEIAGRGLKRARGEKVSEPGQVTNATGNIAVDPELLEFMTPEERALFE